MKRTCPLCGEIYAEYPALSRRDNKTLICPDCGLMEAFIDAGLLEDEAELVRDYSRSKEENK